MINPEAEFSSGSAPKTRLYYNPIVLDNGHFAFSISADFMNLYFQFYSFLRVFLIHDKVQICSICICDILHIFCICIFDLSVYLWHMAVLTGATQQAWNQWEGAEAGSQQLSFFSVFTIGFIIIAINVVTIAIIVIINVITTWLSSKSFQTNENKYIK